MGLDLIYKRVQTILKKDQKGNLTPAEFNLLFNMASDGLFIDRYGLPEDYQPGRAVPRIAYSLTQKIEDDMDPFKQLVESLAIDATTGRANKPADYSHYTAIRKNIQVRNKYCGDEAYKNYDMKDIDVVPESEVAGRMRSKVIPKEKRPFCIFYPTYIQFYPKNLIYCEFVYLRTPVKAVWGYDEVGNRPVYSVAKTTETDWPEDTHVQLTNRVVKLAAMSLREGEIAAMAQQMKEQGE